MASPQASKSSSILEPEPPVTLELMKRELKHTHFVIRKLNLDRDGFAPKSPTLKSMPVNDLMLELINRARTCDGLELEMVKAYYIEEMDTRRQAAMPDIGTASWEGIQIPNTRLGKTIVQYMKLGFDLDKLFYDGIIFQDLIFNQLNREYPIVFLPENTQKYLGNVPKEAEDRFVQCYIALCGAWMDLSVEEYFSDKNKDEDEAHISLSRKLCTADKEATEKFLKELFRIEEGDVKLAIKHCPSMEELRDNKRIKLSESSMDKQ